jgi:hypothetical protein
MAHTMDAYNNIRPQCVHGVIDDPEAGRYNYWLISRTTEGESVWTGKRGFTA